MCLIAVVDTGAQANAWRRCLADSSAAAIAACTEILLLNPRNDGAYVNRGIAHRRAGNAEGAIRDYDAAIRLNPRAADAFNNRGNIWRQRGDTGRALRDYDEAIRLNPHYAHTLNNRGIIFLERGDTENAVADFTRAIDEDPGYANAFRNRGLARTEQRLFDLAIDDFDAAFALNSAVGHGVEYALALFGRGLARRRSGKPGGAADIEEATRLFPGVAHALDESADY